jgi:hypothetical protein
MKLPSRKQLSGTWIVNGKEWVVEFKKINLNDRYAECCEEDKTITIDKRCNRVNTVKSFIHEMLHAFEEEYGFKLSKVHRRGDNVYKLEEALFNFFTEN